MLRYNHGIRIIIAMCKIRFQNFLFLELDVYSINNVADCSQPCKLFCPNPYCWQSGGNSPYLQRRTVQLLSPSTKVHCDDVNNSSVVIACAMAQMFKHLICTSMYVMAGVI